MEIYWFFWWCFFKIYCLMDTEHKFYKMKRVLWGDAGDV